MDDRERKRVPLASGVFDYFPDALAEVAKVSYAGNEKHNPGEPLHWSREKSADHADSMLRHFKDRGSIDPENGMRVSAEMAWRALAILQEEMESLGLAPLARGARPGVTLPEPPRPARAERASALDERNRGSCRPGDCCDLCRDHNERAPYGPFEACANCRRRPR